MVDLFAAALEDQGLDPLPVPDIWCKSVTSLNPNLEQFIEPVSSSGAEALSSWLHKALGLQPEHGTELVVAGELKRCIL